MSVSTGENENRVGLMSDVEGIRSSFKDPIISGYYSVERTDSEYHFFQSEIHTNLIM